MGVAFDPFAEATQDGVGAAEPLSDLVLHGLQEVRPFLGPCVEDGVGLQLVGELEGEELAGGVVAGVLIRAQGPVDVGEPIGDRDGQGHQLPDDPIDDHHGEERGVLRVLLGGQQLRALEVEEQIQGLRADLRVGDRLPQAVRQEGLFIRVEDVALQRELLFEVLVLIVFVDPYEALVERAHQLALHLREIRGGVAGGDPYVLAIVVVEHRSAADTPPAEDVHLTTHGFGLEGDQEADVLHARQRYGGAAQGEGPPLIEGVHLLAQPRSGAGEGRHPSQDPRRVLPPEESLQVVQIVDRRGQRAQVAAGVVGQLWEQGDAPGLRGLLPTVSEPVAPLASDVQVPGGFIRGSFEERAQAFPEEALQPGLDPRRVEQVRGRAVGEPHAADVVHRDPFHARVFQRRGQDQAVEGHLDAVGQLLVAGGLGVVNPQHRLSIALQHLHQVRAAVGEVQQLRGEAVALAEGVSDPQRRLVDPRPRGGSGHALQGLVHTPGAVPPWPVAGGHVTGRREVLVQQTVLPVIATLQDGSRHRVALLVHSGDTLRRAVPTGGGGVAQEPITVEVEVPGDAGG